MVRLFGCGLLALTFASTGWAAEHYVEVWNPPEARKPVAHTPEARTPEARTPAAPARAGKSAEKHASATPKAAAKPHKRRVTQTVKAGSPRPPAAAEAPAAPRPVAQPAPGRLTVMQPAGPDATHALDFSDIPRQYTPDGNVLRVGTHNRSAEVTR
ncbi:hypothetical protein ACPUER_34480 [Burkholderia sp. DN3021]|uniref:hypothetical protein n=1 Tax=Burkholderia TaxID=32008 RepID=UPI0015888909|nr:hypothetical protein [Burkholderia pyrrocinia]